MFAIIISEKGGAERRESFDKSEINVGRVQGNDLMLPKGNVSKHHARLLFRDGRFIVTDLKSTNGTYVNGRKIAQATIVREGDKIYIGDFVLRLETNEAVAGAEAPLDDDESVRTMAREAAARNQAPPPPNPPAVTLKAPTHPPGAPLPRPQPVNVSNAPPPPMTPARGNEGIPQPLGIPGEDVDDSAPMQKPRVTGSAGMQGSPRPHTMPLNQMSPPMIQRPPTAAPGMSSPPMQHTPMPPPVQPPLAQPQTASLPAPPGHGLVQPSAPPPVATPQVRSEPPVPSQHTGLLGQTGLTAQAPVSIPAAAIPPGQPVRPTGPPPRVPPKETPAQAGRRLALMTLLDRIADNIDLSALRASPTVPEPVAVQIERAARDQANAMRDEGDAPEGIDIELVVRDAQREFVGLGPIGPLLEDDDVSEIHCVRFDQVFTTRGQSISLEPIAFSSEESLYRVIARLAQQSGEPWRPGESILERRLARATLIAVGPPSAQSHVLTIRKRRRIEASLDLVVQGGGMSRSMGQFLEACVAARANLLVAGAGAGPLVAALATACAPGERIAVLNDTDEIVVGHAHVVSLAFGDPRKNEDLVRAAARMHPDRLVMAQLGVGAAAAAVDAMAEGLDGVIAALGASSLRQALVRLTGQIAFARPGTSIEAARDVVGEAFDVAVEVTVTGEGRLRVVRIAEIAGADAKGVTARDVFTYAESPNGDGAHSASGTVPRIATEMNARGFRLDPAIFKRGAK